MEPVCKYFLLMRDVCRHSWALKSFSMLPMNRLVSARNFTCLFNQSRVQSVEFCKFRFYLKPSACSKAPHLEAHFNSRLYSSTNVPKDSKSSHVPPEDNQVKLTFDEELAQLSFFQRYKKLLKEYWYVLIPTHFFTSAVWFSSLYLLAKSGIKIDIDAILDLNILPESFAKALRNGSLGSLALALALYKLVSPFRYMSTVYIAVPTIRVLVRRGIIKPIPKLTSSSKIQREISNIRNRIVKKRGTR